MTMEETIGPTVEVGEEVEVRITNLGKYGDPVGKHEKFVIFVNDKTLKPGQVVKVKVTDVRPKCANADLIAVIE